MIKKVIKRNGKQVPFDITKIQKAVARAYTDVYAEEKYDKDTIKEFATAVATIVTYNNLDNLNEETVSVEEIQDVVEQVLMDVDKDVAKSYIKYRYEHELARQKYTDEQILNMVKGQDEYWAKENSNKNPELVTVQRDYLAGITSTDIARRYIFPKDVIEAHDNGFCHQHDMDYMAQATLHNCDLINLDDMLQNGTVVNNVKINKPHRLLTAMTIATQIMASVAGSSYGGMSITLTHLAPFVRDSYNIFKKKYEDAGLAPDMVKKLAKKDLDKEISDSVQTFNYQISTLFSLNGQSPFCSLFMYLNETEEYKEELILLIKEFLRQRIKGMPNRDGIPVTQAFPKLLYVLEEDNYKPGTKYWEVTKMAVACSACRLTPDYISEKKMKEIKINGNGEGDCFACMGL